MHCATATPSERLSSVVLIRIISEFLQGLREINRNFWERQVWISKAIIGSDRIEMKGRFTRTGLRMDF